MSISDTLRPLSSVGESEGAYQLLDGYAYGRGGLGVNAYPDSPYTDREIINLDVGSNQTRFRVHRILLSQSQELDAKLYSKLWGEKINDTIVLPDLDEATAHSLVHYLYTGRYQTLTEHKSSENGGAAGYKLGTCVYCAATRYKLPGLAELAREKITSLGEELSILVVLRIAREDAFPGLPEEESWFPAYLEEAIKAAHAEDQELFLKPSFIDQIQGDRKFRQIVMKAVVSQASKGYTGQSTPAMEPKVEQTAPKTISEIKEVEEPKVNGSDARESDIVNGNTAVPTATPDLEKHTLQPVTPLDLGSKKEDPKLVGRVDSPIATPAQPEPGTDETGWGNSKTYQKLGKNVEKSAEAKESKQEVQVPAAPQSKQDVVKEESKPVVESKPVGEATVSPSEPVVEVASPVDDPKVNGTSNAKKDKKKKKKKEAKEAKEAAAAAKGPEKTELANGNGIQKQGVKTVAH